MHSSLSACSIESESNWSHKCETKRSKIAPVDRQVHDSVPYTHSTVQIQQHGHRSSVKMASKNLHQTESALFSFCTVNMSNPSTIISEWRYSQVTHVCNSSQAVIWIGNQGPYSWPRKFIMNCEFAGSFVWMAFTFGHVLPVAKAVVGAFVILMFNEVYWHQF